jgi:hypothetical protein
MLRSAVAPIRGHTGAGLHDTGASLPLHAHRTGKANERPLISLRLCARARAGRETTIEVEQTCIGSSGKLPGRGSWRAAAGVV